jgi:thiol-disulfide isomerase/thioredoxin
MKYCLAVAGIFFGSVLGAQSYEQVLKQCIKNFHEGLGSFSREKAQTEIERRYSVLNECMKGQKFPAFNLTTYDGSKYTSEQNRNKVVLLNFWFTKSPTSVAAIPYLNELADEYKGKDFVILSFSTDGFAVLSSFLKEHPVKFRVFDKSRDLINHQFYTLLGYPTNIFLNKQGEVVDYQVGGSIKPEELSKIKEGYRKLIEEELAK